MNGIYLKVRRRGAQSCSCRFLASAAQGRSCSTEKRNVF
jgi:hypothetical protein